MTDVERLTHRLRHLDRADAGRGHVIDEHPLRGGAAIVWQHDRTPVEQPVPEELLPVKRLPRPVDKWRAERDDGEPGGLMHSEQQPFSGRLVQRVRVRDVVRHEGIALAKAKPRRVGGDAGHEHVTLQPIATASRGALHMGGGGAFLPVGTPDRRSHRTTPAAAAAPREEGRRGRPGGSSPGARGRGSRDGAAPSRHARARAAARRFVVP